MALTWICQFPFQEEGMKWLSVSIDWQDFVVSVQVAYSTLRPHDYQSLTGSLWVSTARECNLIDIFVTQSLSTDWREDDLLIVCPSWEFCVFVIKTFIPAGMVLYAIEKGWANSYPKGDLVVPRKNGLKSIAPSHT